MYRFSLIKDNELIVGLLLDFDAYKYIMLVILHKRCIREPNAYARICVCVG
jgi:hypothetical protein